MDIGNMREEFTKGGLQKKDLAEDPFLQFEKWFIQATEADAVMANAMTLASVRDGQPSVRTVLLKMFDHKGFVFYTNYGSRKSKEMDANGKVALLFHWPELQRQVKIEGIATRVSTAETTKYFLSRPRGSQIGAWASNQSEVISSRQLLMAKVEEFKMKFKKGEVPVPEFWGGYRVKPHRIEFWQGRKSRLHDRFAYTLDGEHWKVERLAP